MGAVWVCQDANPPAPGRLAMLSASCLAHLHLKYPPYLAQAMAGSTYTSAEILPAGQRLQDYQHLPTRQRGHILRALPAALAAPTCAHVPCLNIYYGSAGQSPHHRLASPAPPTPKAGSRLARLAECGILLGHSQQGCWDGLVGCSHAVCQLTCTGLGLGHISRLC